MMLSCLSRVAVANARYLTETVQLIDFAQAGQIRKIAHALIDLFLCQRTKYSTQVNLSKAKAYLKDDQFFHQISKILVVKGASFGNCDIHAEQKSLYISFNIVISCFRFSAIQNFKPEFWSVSRFGNFGLIIRKRWRKTKKVNIEVTQYNQITVILAFCSFSFEFEFEWSLKAIWQSRMKSATGTKPKIFIGKVNERV